MYQISNFKWESILLICLFSMIMMKAISKSKSKKNSNKQEKKLNSKKNNPW